MAIGYAFALAAITQQVNQINESVNGAFLPLISNACEMPQRLNAEEAFRRCSAIAGLSQEVENTATAGMRHLEAFRDGKLVADNLPEDFCRILTVWQKHVAVRKFTSWRCFRSRKNRRCGRGIWAYFVR